MEGDVVREAGVAIAIACAACRAPVAPAAGGELPRWDVGGVWVSGAPPLDQTIVDELAPYAAVAGWRLADISADGRRVLAISRNRLYELDGPNAKPRPIAADGSVRWAAYLGGTSIVVATDHDGDERMTLWKDGARVADDVFDPIVARGHLAWAQHSPDGARTIVWVGGVALFAGDGMWAPLDVSEDGAHVLARKTIGARTSAIYRYDVETARTTALTPTDRRAAAVDARFYRDSVLAIADLGEDKLQLYHLDPPYLIPTAPDGDIEQLAIAADGRFASTKVFAGRSRWVGADGELLSSPLEHGVVANLRYAESARKLALTFTDPLHPPRIVVDPFQHPTTWIGIDAARLDPVAPKSTRMWSFDNTPIHVDIYASSRVAKSPVILELHGGPEDQFRPRWQPFVQFLVSRGFAVVQPDVRGSTGYGAAFAALDDGPRREDAVRDVGAVLDWIRTRPDLDADRVFVMGTSYGGFVALSALARFPDRLRGGIVLSGIADLPSFLETTRADRRDNRRAEYGDERDPQTRAFLARISPLANVDKIRAPVLVAHGRRDPRVPIAVAERFVAALRAAGKTAWYVVADDEGHGFNKAEARGVYEVLAAEFLATYATASRSR